MKILVRAELDFNDMEHLSLEDFNGNEYIIGYGFNGNYILTENGDMFSIKEDTKSIHFENMLDSQGNKIFASFNKSGKGGDMLETIERNKSNSNTKKIKVTTTFNSLSGMDYSFLINGEDYHYRKEDLKIIGIQK
jgi:hypothetical protein